MPVSPGLQALEQQRSAEVAPPVDGVLVRLCVKLRKDQGRKCRSGNVEPQDWESFSHDAAAELSLVQMIAETSATSCIGLRAKALALHALLDEGGGELCEDASAPDLLAWSLVRDFLIG